MNVHRFAQQFLIGTAVFSAILVTSLVLRAYILVDFSLIDDLGPSTPETGIVTAIDNHGHLAGVRGDNTQRIGALWEGPNQPCQVVPSLHGVSGINSLRQAAASVWTPAGIRAAFWDSQSGLVLIDPGGKKSCSYGLNDQSVVVGCYWMGSRPRGFFWSAADGIQDVSHLIGEAVAYAKDINNKGEIVGQLELPQGGQPFIWSPNTGLLRLDCPGCRDACAHGVNESGYIVGHFERLDQQHAACLWTLERKLIDLNSLLPPGTRWQLQAAWSINDSGQVVGYGLYNGRSHDFLLDVRSLMPTETLAAL